ncbi:daunorubicin resistance protein DrrA family ABC transporter ATP-binding protein [Methanomassiliicoccus luminyensis]|uniref:daunorubicin resistance protein DrrA family ABC transporter ATP-binding protein n=1 Tax=Methanomassiliicoccus luminyensis TaxID=1080712 RepID=UPI00036BA4E7|nr:daunorubicin resistance protein DrrA family ABC transporter ATP-binding protein [Methanomassiliicoccus luminyensis]
MTAIVEVKDLTKRFSEDVLAVDGVSFEVHEGEIFGFLGPNGAGKSTTINMLTTLLKPTGGKALIAGLDIATQQDAVRKVIGLVPQDLTVDDELSGRENMFLQADLYNVPREEAKKDIQDLLRVVNLEDAADRLVKTYSGGMRKRLELAEGLIHHPRILFLDEPTLGLDIQTRAAIWDYIKDLKAKHNITVFLTTHYLEEADSLCDRIGIIDHGKIVALDTPTMLKRAVGGDVIDLTVEGDRDFTEVLGCVESVTDVKRENGHYRIKADKGEASIPKVLLAVTNSGGVVTNVSLHRPSLDQAFLEYTGRSMRDAESGGGFDIVAASRASRRRR